MEVRVVSALIGAGAVLVSFSGAGAAERTVKVSNGSVQVIREIYAAPADTGDYRNNLLGSAIRIQSGGSASVTFDDGGACAFDFQAFTGDDDMLLARNVDVCGAAEVTLR